MAHFARYEPPDTGRERGELDFDVEFRFRVERSRKCSRFRSVSTISCNFAKVSLDETSQRTTRAGVQLTQHR